jgi:hypothetical protein
MGQLGILGSAEDVPKRHENQIEEGCMVELMRDLSNCCDSLTCLLRHSKECIK